LEVWVSGFEDLKVSRGCRKYADTLAQRTAGQEELIKAEEAMVGSGGLGLKGWGFDSGVLRCYRKVCRYAE
jgi:hypothetical protein